MHKIRGPKTLEQIIFLLLQPFSDELFALPSKMIQKSCLIVTITYNDNIHIK